MSRVQEEQDDQDLTRPVPPRFWSWQNQPMTDWNVRLRASRSLLVLAGLVLLAACGKTASEKERVPTQDEPPGKNEIAAPAPLAVPLAETPGERAAPLPPGMGVVYECPERPLPREECASTPGWVVDLHHAAQRIQIEETPHHRPAPAEHCEQADAMIAEGLKAMPDSLTWQERVVVQSASLTVAAGSGCLGNSPSRKQAARLASMMALAPSVLRPLGSQASDELETWLGPRANWQDMKRTIPLPEASDPDGSLRHNESAYFLRAFRPIRAGSTRAIFSQLVAIDTAGDAQVTPLVASLELRTGLDAAASACVIELDVRRLRCESGRLRPAALSDFPEHSRGFVRRSEDSGRVLCDSCHGIGPTGGTTGGIPPDHSFFGDLEVVPAGEAEAQRAARRTLLLSGARETVKNLSR